MKAPAKKPAAKKTRIGIDSIDSVLRDIRAGKPVIVVDDADRENEGDLILAAEKATADNINFLVTYGRGMVCAPITQDRAAKLGLNRMVLDNRESFKTDFTVTVDAAHGVTTGISAEDRAKTIRLLANPKSVPGDLVQPGHIFPLMAEPGGVLRRAGHTEAACDFARLAGCEPVGVICEIMNDDGTMARRPDLEKFAELHGIKIGTIADLIHYRMVNEQTVQRVSEQVLPTEFGDFRMIVYREHAGSLLHIAVVQGELSPDKLATVRVHVLNPLRDMLHAKFKGRVGWNLQKSLQEIAGSDSGVLVLLGREIDSAELEQHLADFNAQRPRAADGAGMYRNIGTGSQILRDLGVRKMRLLSSPMRFNALSGFGLEIVEYVTTD